uniref:Uncharacterized protein n=1 Tax=Solanum lycopersicum TaxID=4081 RepID=A0A3Q7I1Q3_SOLLC
MVTENISKQQPSIFSHHPPSLFLLSPPTAEETPKIPSFSQVQRATASSHQNQTSVSIFSFSSSSLARPRHRNKPATPKLQIFFPLLHFSGENSLEHNQTIPVSPSQSDLTHNQTQTPIHFLIIPARSSKL